LKIYNWSEVEPHQTHVKKGWTQFLKEVGHPDMFDNKREPKCEAQQNRKKLLAQIYQVLILEQEYKKGGAGLFV
jgi:hypothetical protein